MKKTLRYYQAEAVDALMSALKDKASIPYADLCTGFGKSLVAAHITNIGLKNGRRILQIVPKRELVEQNYKEAAGYVDEPNKIGICCAALSKREVYKPAIIATPGSFKASMFKAGVIDLVIVDEAHKAGIDEQGEIRKIIRYLTNKNPNMRVIGITGSPYRIDQGMLHHQVPKGKEGSRLFTKCCYHSDIKRLISEGYLSEIKNISGSLHADLEGLKGKEYSAGLMGVRFDAIVAKAVADMREKYKSYGITTSLIYASTIDNAKKILAEWGDASTMRIVCGDMPKEERKAIIKWIEHGQGERHIVNVEILTTGFDYTGLQCVTLLVATKSVAKYVQIVGRVIRAHEDKEYAYFLDYGTNAQRLGAIDEITVRPPSVGDGSVPFRTCGLCGNQDAIHAKHCTDCGEAYPVPEKGGYQLWSTAPVIQNKSTETYQIYAVDATLATSKIGIPMVKMIFYGENGDMLHQHYLCIEHEGYAKQQAIKTLLSLLKPEHQDYFFVSMLNDETALNSGCVLEMFEEYGHWFRPVKAVTLTQNGKYKELNGVFFA